MNEIEDELKYYKEWVKQDFVNSGIGTGNLSMDQEIGCFFAFLKDLEIISISKNNMKLCQKIHEDRDKIIDVIDKRLKVDKELTSVLEEIVDYYMKL